MRYMKFPYYKKEIICNVFSGKVEKDMSHSPKIHQTDYDMTRNGTLDAGLWSSMAASRSGTILHVALKAKQKRKLEQLNET